MHPKSVAVASLCFCFCGAAAHSQAIEVYRNPEEAIAAGIGRDLKSALLNFRAYAMAKQQLEGEIANARGQFLASYAAGSRDRQAESQFASALQMKDFYFLPFYASGQARQTLTMDRAAGGALDGGIPADAEFSYQVRANAIGEMMRGVASSNSEALGAAAAHSNALYARYVSFRNEAEIEHWRQHRKISGGTPVSGPEALADPYVRMALAPAIGAQYGDQPVGSAVGSCQPISSTASGLRDGARRHRQGHLVSRRAPIPAGHRLVYRPAEIRGAIACSRACQAADERDLSGGIGDSDGCQRRARIERRPAAGTRRRSAPCHRDRTDHCRSGGLAPSCRLSLGRRSVRAGHRRCSPRYAGGLGEGRCARSHAGRHGAGGNLGSRNWQPRPRSRPDLHQPGQERAGDSARPGGGAGRRQVAMDDAVSDPECLRVLQAKYGPPLSASQRTWIWGIHAWPCAILRNATLIEFSVLQGAAPATLPQSALRWTIFGLGMDTIAPGSPASDPSVFSKCGPLLEISRNGDRLMEELHDVRIFAAARAARKVDQARTAVPPKL